MKPSNRGGPPVPQTVPLVALGLFTFLLYAPSLSLALTNWDDPDYITNNWLVAAGWPGVADAFSHTFDGAYYPLTQALYVVVHALGGETTALHVLLVVLFAVTVALVPLALEGFGVPRVAGIAAAVVWAAHPFRPESVSWVSNLKDTLGGLFVVAAFAVFAKERRAWATVLFVAAVLSKSAFFGLALAFPLVELRRSGPRATALRTAPLVVVGLATAIGSGRLHLSGRVVSQSVATLGDRVATAAWTPWWYVGRVLGPWGPRAVYDVAPVHFGDLRFVLAVGGWAALAAAVWKWRRLAGPVVVFLVALAPVSGLVPLRHLVADRYTLFPSLAMAAALGVWAFERWPRLAVRGTVVVALLLIPLNVLRQREWRDGVSLWEANVALSPDNPTARMNLAEAYATAGRTEPARVQTLELLRLRPGDIGVLRQLFWLSGQLDGVAAGELADRRDVLAQAGFSTDAVLLEAERCLSSQQMNAADALLTYSPSVKDDPRALRMRSVVARRQRRLPEALEFAQRALSLGDARARVELVFALTDAGRVDEALRESATVLDDAYAAALLRAARAYALQRAGRVEEARMESEAAMEVLRR